MIAPSDYTRIARAIEWLDAHALERPALADAARAAGLSAPHFQRVFTQWAGISPKRFQQARTAETALRLLRNGRAVLDTAYEAGLSGPSRLHDLVVHAEAVTPGELKSRGAGLAIRYGWHPTPFGDALIAATPRGLCFLAFASVGGRAAAVDDLHARWPAAELERDDELRRHRPRRGQAYRPARRRQRRWGESDLVAHPLPPRTARRRRTGRICVGTRAKTDDAGVGVYENMRI